MNFSKTTSYSLNIMSYMAGHESLRMSASYLHQKLRIPYSYLRTILSGLSRKNLISSKKGRHGGFILSRDKSSIFLDDVIRATERPDIFTRCIMGFDACPFNYGCSMHPIWIKMRADILLVFQNTSLADLLAKQKTPDKSK